MRYRMGEGQAEKTVWQWLTQVQSPVLHMSPSHSRPANSDPCLSTEPVVSSEHCKCSLKTKQTNKRKKTS